MAKRGRSPDSGGTTAAAETYNTVYIDTNIDTHFGLIISHCETISGLKDLIVFEHGLFFPEIGAVKVHGVKVKWNEIFYYLPDYMLVKSAFEGDTSRWFLSVDVSKCNDALEIVRHGASNLLAYDQGHLHDGSFKIPHAVDRVQAADVQKGRSSKREYNIPASNQEFKDDNVPNDVSNLGSYSSGRSVKTCNSSKKLKRKHNSLQATSVPKETNMSSQALCGNKLHLETGNTTVKRINKAGKLLGSHVEFEPHIDGQETSSCNVEKSKQNRKSSLHVHEQAPSSMNSPKCVQVNDVTAPASICSPGIHNLLHDIMPKMDYMGKTVERNLYSLHDPDVNRTGELNFAQDGLEKPGESALPSALSDTKEAKIHKKRSKNKARSSKSKFMDDHDDQVRNSTADSHLVFPDSTDLELPAKSEKGRLFSGKHDVTALGPLGSSGINHMHDDMLKVDSLNKSQEKKLSTVDDPEMRRTEELDLLHCKSTGLPGLLVIKEGKTHENSRKKRSKTSRSGVPDEHVVDRPGLEVVAASDHHCCESTIVKGKCSSKADVRNVEKNLFTETVDTDEGTEGVKRDGEKKKMKVQKSGVGAKYQENRESIVSENALNLEHVPEKGLSTNSDCPDIPKSLEVNGATEDGNTIDEKKKKQKADKAVATVQDTGDINRDSDQFNDVRDVEQNLLTKTVDTDEGTVNCGGKKIKKKVRKVGAGAKDQQNRESIVAENDLNLQQVPETQLSSNSDCPDVPKPLEVNEATEDGKATDKNKKKQRAEKVVATVQDTSDMIRDADQPNYVRAVEQNPLTKTVNTDEATEGTDCGGKKKKKKKVRKSGAGSKDQQNRETIVAENYLNLEQVPETQLSSNSDYPDVPQALEVNEAIEDWKATDENKRKQKAVARVKDTGDMTRNADQINDIRDVEQNLSTKSVDTDATEGVNCGGDEKKRKVQKSGAAAKDRENQESIVAEDDWNLEQVREKGMPTNSNCPDVLKALNVNEVTEDGKAIEEKEENAETAVAEVQDTDDMNQDADQINDTVSPSVAIHKSDYLMPPIENDETYQKIAERDKLVNDDFEKMVLSRDVPSYRDQNEPVIKTVSNTNTSTATVVEEQKMSGTRIKKRARKTVSGVLQDGVETEKTETRTRSSLKGWNSHADVQVEKDKDLLPASKRIEASVRISSDTSRGKSTPPMESPLTQVSAELENQKDGEVYECIGKDINFKQYFVPIHPQDDVTSEQSADSVNKKRKEVIPSAPKLVQDFPESTEKVSIISSAGKGNNLAESNRVTKTKKKTGKRGVPYATTSSDLDEFRTPTKLVSSAFLNCSDATKTVPRKKETAKSLAASGVNSSTKMFGKPPLKSNTRGRKESSLRPDVTTGKDPSSKLSGEVVNKSEQEKTLGQTPKSIFRDVSSESSLGENGSVDSSASTGTPSDLSSSSDLSEDAATNGHDGKAKGGVKKSVSNSEISGQKHIPLSTVLRSSSRFKKAKVTASQQYEEPDSQPDESLPEMQLFP